MLGCVHGPCTIAQGRLPTYAEEAILTKSSVGAMSRLRRALLPSLYDTETFEGIPSTDGDVLDVPADGSDALPRTGSRTDSEIEPAAHAKPQHRITLQDFEILAVIGRGGYGKVFQVRRKGSAEIYAMKTLKKKDLITRRQVCDLFVWCLSWYRLYVCLDVRAGISHHG